MAYYLRKLVGFAITIMLVSVLTFLVFQVLPGDPSLIILGIDADPVQLENLRESMNMDKSYLERYLLWVQGALTGDLGMSYRYHQDVSSLISDAFGVTASLALMSIGLTFIIGLPLGIFLAKHHKKKWTIPLSMLTQVGISVPSFCMAVFLISIFAVQLRWFSAIYIVNEGDTLGYIKSLFLPALSIAVGSSAVLIRYIKVSVVEQQKKDYARTARSKGIGESKVMNLHVLRNALIPVITIFGMLTASVLGGSIIVENVFGLPGIGRLVSSSVTTRDLPLIQGLVLYLSIIVVITNFSVDILYSIIDPRITKKS